MVPPRNANVNPGRNDPCPCGSGKKYKKCCAGAPRQRLARQADEAGDEAQARWAPGELSRAELQSLSGLLNGGCHLELEAKARGLLIQFPNSGLLWKILGLSLWMQGKDAVPCLKRAAELFPDDAEAQSNLGNAFRAAGQYENAVDSQRRALALKPDYAHAHNNLGSALLDLGRVDEAIESFGRAAALNPDFALAYSNLGNAFMVRNQADAAESSCRRALEIDPRLSAAIVQIAEIQAARGLFDEAAETLRQAISTEPDMPEAWSALVRLRKMTASDSAWLAQVQRIVARPLPPRREVPLRYALGKYFDDVGDYAQAFENYRRANDISNTNRPHYELRNLAQGIDRLIGTHTREWLSRASADSSASRRPVFIVGMPRSGTTLAEQILASHPQVHGAGELDFWTKAARTHGSSQVPFDEPKAIGARAGEYLALLSSLCPDAQRVVDKMPGNFLYLGLIHAALPNARIIHMRRDPVDTCLSIYFHDFGRAHPYSSDLNDLAAYFAEYSRLMEHWHAMLPAGAILDVPYDALVRDQEAWSRAMVEFIGLPWDRGCLEFHRGARTVSTHSKWQARQKISAASVGRWRNYERFLGPLRALADGHEREAAPIGAGTRAVS
jgi:tetratricopeptide (TPR) repeat protein